MAKTITQIQQMITDGYDQRQIINELADWMQANSNEGNLAGYLSLDENSPESVNKVWVGSQIEYDGLTPISTTLYFITE